MAWGGLGEYGRDWLFVMKNIFIMLFIFISYSVG